jgi:hypothetical protein
MQNKPLQPQLAGNRYHVELSFNSPEVGFAEVNTSDNRTPTPKEQLCVRGKHLEAKLCSMLSQPRFRSL